VNLGDPVKLVSQLLDLPIIDQKERWCGIVDDVELEGGAGKALRVTALLVGPGAYECRLPLWMYSIIRLVAGDRMVRVPSSEVIEIGAVVKLKSNAESLQLRALEEKAARWIPHSGAM
jgi:sporulation protein YlmC with PRC-barrel domain